MIRTKNSTKGQIAVPGDKRGRIGLLGATFETQNLGVSALAAGTIKCVLSQYPQARVFFLDYARESSVRTLLIEGRQVRVPLVNMRFSKKFYLPNNIAVLLMLALILRLAPFARARKWLIERNSCLREIYAADLFASIAGGDSFSDIYGLERLLYVSLPQILALWAGKRLILLPQTLGPFKGRFARAIAKYIMKRAEVVYSRDYAGVKLGAEMLGGKAGFRIQESGPISGLRWSPSDSGYRRVPSPESRIPNPESRIPNPEPRIPIPKVQFCYDVGFLVDPIPPAGMDIVGLAARSQESGVRSQETEDGTQESGARTPESLTPNPESLIPNPGPLVGLNVSGLLFMGGYNRNNMFGLRADYRSLIYRLIQFLIEQKKTAVILIPHVFGTQGESDSSVCEKIFEELKGKYKDSLGLVRGRYNQSEIKYIIGQCDFFIGSRMHACIAAVSQCIPAVSIAYSDKFIGVMETVGVEALVADPRKMDEDAIIGIIDRAFQEREGLREQLEQKMPQVKETVLRLFENSG